jgi:F-box domain
MNSQQTQITAARAGKDYLTSMPPEILFNIISHLPSSSWVLPLVKVCHRLRQYMKKNAAQICNSFILSRFRSECGILQPVLADGWLVPTRCCMRQEGNIWEGCMLALQSTPPGSQYLQSLEEWALYAQMHLELFADPEEEVDAYVLKPEVGCRILRGFLAGKKSFLLG